MTARAAAIARCSARIKLADTNQARLTLALCLEEFGRDGPSDELRQVIIEGLTVRLESIADVIRAQGIPVEVRTLFGRAFLEIIVQVLSKQHDLVIKTALGRANHKPVFFGSTDMHLMRKCPCPVWMINPWPRECSGGVLAAVDTEAVDREKQAVSTMIMELATSLALLAQLRRFGACLRGVREASD